MRPLRISSEGPGQSSSHCRHWPPVHTGALTATYTGERFCLRRPEGSCLWLRVGPPARILVLRPASASARSLPCGTSATVDLQSNERMAGPFLLEKLFPKGLLTSLCQDLAMAHGTGQPAVSSLCIHSIQQNGASGCSVAPQATGRGPGTATAKRRSALPGGDGGCVRSVQDRVRQNEHSFPRGAYAN